MNRHMVQLLRELYGYRELSRPYTPPLPGVFIPRTNEHALEASYRLQDIGLVRLVDFSRHFYKLERVGVDNP